MGWDIFSSETSLFKYICEQNILQELPVPFRLNIFVALHLLPVCKSIKWKWCVDFLSFVVEPHRRMKNEMDERRRKQEEQRQRDLEREEQRQLQLRIEEERKELLKQKRSVNFCWS